MKTIKELIRQEATEVADRIMVKANKKYKNSVKGDAYWLLHKEIVDLVEGFYLEEK